MEVLIESETRQESIRPNAIATTYGGSAVVRHLRRGCGSQKCKRHGQHLDVADHHGISDTPTLTGAADNGASEHSIQLAWGRVISQVRAEPRHACV